MKKYLKRLTKTQFMILVFIPFGLWGFCSNGLPGLLAAMFGWYLGGVIWRNRASIKKFNAKKFFKKYAVPIINLLILIPVDALAYHIGGWTTFFAVTVGWIIGMLTWRWRKGRW